VVLVASGAVTPRTGHELELLPAFVPVPVPEAEDDADALLEPLPLDDPTGPVVEQMPKSLPCDLAGTHVPAGTPPPQSLSVSQTWNVVHEVAHVVLVSPAGSCHVLPQEETGPGVPVPQQTWPLGQSTSARQFQSTSPVAQVVPSARQVAVPLEGSQQCWPAEQLPALPPLPTALNGQYTPAVVSA
jgi:hypothetical protein